jgi:hypothetical protein
MSNNFGTGVSRVLDPSQTGYQLVIWQQGKPPTDAALNLIGQISAESTRILALRGVPSGFLANDINPERDYVTDPSFSNWFRFGQQKSGEKQTLCWAVCNGWLVPVTGTQTGTPPGSPNNTDTWNRVTLGPPPSNSGDNRIDFVFLEVWLARIPPNPSTLNKPAAASVYRYGNVESGNSFIPDDLVDPAIGFETEQRTQLQYRVRVVTGLIGLSSFPDGFDPAVVKAQGAAGAPTAFTFTNMRQELGDPGLWRAGDGTANGLGTVDGYVYAIPMTAVFRRNSAPWDADPSQNLNGGFNRNPTAIDRTGWKTFSTVPTLAASLTDVAMTLTLSAYTANTIPLPTNPATDVYVQIGDEVIRYQAISGTTMTITGRGQLGTKAEAHFIGDKITVLSGRPDSLYSDQIAKTDILDLRHAVNPNGFDYTALLRQNFDKLLRGQLRANWKKSGASPQGPFVFYQDKVGAAAPLGVTKLDTADNIRMVYSDAAMVQPVEVIIAPSGAATPPNQSVGTSWGLGLTATATTQLTPNVFTNGDVIVIPIAQFKNSVGSDTDQVRFILDNIAGAVTVRIDGSPIQLVQGVHFQALGNGPYVTMTPLDDLRILILPAWPTAVDGAAVGGVGRNVYVTVHLQYGGGRGLSRRPDSLHKVSFLNPNVDVMAQLAAQPALNVPMRVSWTALWSKFQTDTLRGLLPSTSEAYADLGSKTVVLTPFRRIVPPAVLRSYDGDHVNVDFNNVRTNGTTVGSGTTTFTDGAANFPLAGVTVGDCLDIYASSNPLTEGTYRVVGAIGATSFTVDRVVPVAASLSYQIESTQGVMPSNDISGVPKPWGPPDPLNLFSSHLDGTAPRKNIFATLPRHLVPGWGEVKVPILWNDTATFSRGINYLFRSNIGVPASTTFVSYANGGVSGLFSTVQLNTLGLLPATFNTNTGAFGIGSFAGIRKYTDTRGLGRQGLELPPFYGIARLFAVYEAVDYKAHGTGINAATRAPTGSLSAAVNLLRQNFDGPTFWIELDADGDSTFILNAEAIDLKKSTFNPLANFASGDYVIEASIFGFDRGSFDIGKQFRAVLTRERIPAEANNGLRTNNFLREWNSSAATTGSASGLSGTNQPLVVPGPAPLGEEFGISFTRQPYQGDAWGSQTVYQDSGQTIGPLTSANLYQLVNTVLDPTALTRPNQKPLEVLAAIQFTTTLGTGRLSGVAGFGLNAEDVGYEDAQAFPPASPVATRPRTKSQADMTGTQMGSDYLGCTDRLPLGASFRDKDFHGEVAGSTGEAFQYHGEVAPGLFLSAQAASSLEQTELNVSTAYAGSGSPGDIVVQVDGEQGNYNLLTNFRTNRGGSLFMGSGPHPGGDFAASFENFTAGATPRNLLGGVAMLVRNQVTNIGASESSAGDELMMVIVTTGIRSQGTATGTYVAISTAGTGESISASDLYRISGHPLLRDNQKTEIDPNTFRLSLGIPLILDTSGKAKA